MNFSKDTVSVALLLLFVAGCSTAPTHVDCAAVEVPKLIYTPPLTPVFAVTSHFKQSANLHFTGVPTPSTEYRPYAKILVRIASNGVPTDVRFPLKKGFESTGNRDVDIAIKQWAMDMRFNGSPCNNSKQRVVGIPVYLAH